MSIQKQIKKNIEKQTKATIRQYEPFLKPDWESVPMKDLNVFASLAKNGITVQDLNREIAKARKQAYEDTVTAVMKVVYASVALTLTDDYGFSKDECLDALGKIDHRMALTIDNEEIVREMEDRIGIRFNSENGVERVEII